ncbi:MAG: hypothetical protein J6T62_10320 [Fibrobacter sp.]|nr:hypothetical protein [Fibrobacter sp.]
MESDSLIENDATVDSSAPEQVLPSPEQLGISVSSSPVPELTVGDTFDYQVTVSWSVQGSSLLVVPVSSATAKGLAQLGMSQESARSVKDGAEIASITFTYKLMAQDTGNLNIPALRFEIPTALGSSIDLRSESVPVRVESPFNPLPLAVGAAVAVCVLLAGLWRTRRRAAARAAEAAKSAAERSLRERMDVLKQRVNVADSREWLLELESACKEYAQEKLGLAAADVNLESLMKDGKLEGWETLVEEFAHARYGGGQRDGFQNLETWKAAIRLMGIKEE